MEGLLVARIENSIMVMTTRFVVSRTDGAYLMRDGHPLLATASPGNHPPWPRAEAPDVWEPFRSRTGRTSHWCRRATAPARHSGRDRAWWTARCVARKAPGASLAR